MWSAFPVTWPYVYWRATLCPGDYAWVEVIDQAGAWTRDDHGRGLAIVAAVAGDGN